MCRDLLKLDLDVSTMTSNIVVAGHLKCPVYAS